MSTQLRIRERIEPINQNLSWLRAFNAMKPLGGMPRHVLLDRHLCDEGYRNSLSEEHRTAINHTFPLWSGDLYVHKAPGEQFIRGADIMSGGMLLLWSEIVRRIPASELVRRKTSLVVAPNELIPSTVEFEAVNIIVPAEIRIVHPTVEAHGAWGNVDKATGMVLKVSDRRLAKLADAEKRRLYLSAEEIRPLVRDDGDGRGVYADYWVSGRLGVSRVVYDVLDASGGGGGTNYF